MLLLLIMAALCLMVAGQDGKYAVCERLMNIADCHCPFVKTEVSCADITLDKMRGIMNVTKGKKVHLEFFVLDIKELPTDLFHGQAIEFFRVKGGKIGSFGDKPFSGLEDSLKTLILSQSTDAKKNPFSGFTLTHLKKLESLTIDREGLREIPDSWLNGEFGESLEEIAFENNKIVTIGENAFFSLVNLEEVWMFNNRIESIKRSMFPKPANRLRRLQLGNNKIKDLPSDIFSEMPSLMYIELSSNNIYTLDQTTWQEPINNIADIYLVGNPLHCDKNIRWIFDSNVPKRLHGWCDSPESMSRKRLKDLVSDDFDYLDDTNSTLF